MTFVLLGHVRFQAIRNRTFGQRPVSRIGIGAATSGPANRTSRRRASPFRSTAAKAAVAV